MKTIAIPQDQKQIILLLKLFLFYRPSGLAVFFRCAKFPERTELIQLILTASRPEEYKTSIATSRARQFEMILNEFGGLARWQHIFCNYGKLQENAGEIIVLRHWPELKRRWKQYYRQESFLPSQIAGFTPTNISDERLYPDRRLALQAIEGISRIIYEYMPQYS